MNYKPGERKGKVFAERHTGEGERWRGKLPRSQQIFLLHSEVPFLVLARFAGDRGKGRRFGEANHLSLGQSQGIMSREIVGPWYNRGL